MKFSTRSRYALRALLELGLDYGKGPLQLKEIAKRQDISSRYLERIFSMLVSHGIIESLRGQHGGFVLSKPPQEIKLSQIVKIVEGPIAPVVCVSNPARCKRSSICAVRDVWEKIAKAILEILNSMTLKDLVELQNKKLSKAKVIYNI
jgi:Rrf2 family protein